MTNLLRAAFVIGRRDFTAILFSKAFFFFLLGPLFPVIVGVAAGGVTSQVARDIDRPVIGLAMTRADNQALIAARDRLAASLENKLVEMREVFAVDAEREPLSPAQLLADKDRHLAAVVTGSLANPVLSGKAGDIRSWRGQVALLAAEARSGRSVKPAPVTLKPVADSAGSAKELQLVTAQGAQSLLFLLTMLLAGMVLSNLVEEKSNKIIEVLAAAVPIDAVFLGKLFAMLAMAFVGIAVWTSIGVLALTLWGPGLPSFPAPAVGWPLFVILVVIYFASAYLMLGSLFLGIGAQAATVRDVQTLSMPVTMSQLLIFFFAMYTVTKIGQPIEIAAAIFPFSSPFVMVARAAQSPDLLPHLVAIVGQVLFATLLLRVGVTLFRRNVMKSGRTGARRRRFGRRPAAVPSEAPVA